MPEWIIRYTIYKHAQQNKQIHVICFFSSASVHSERPFHHSMSPHRLAQALRGLELQKRSVMSAERDAAKRHDYTPKEYFTFWQRLKETVQWIIIRTSESERTTQ